MNSSCKIVDLWRLFQNPPDKQCYQLPGLLSAEILAGTRASFAMPQAVNFNPAWVSPPHPNPWLSACYTYLPLMGTTVNWGCFRKQAKTSFFSTAWHPSQDENGEKSRKSQAELWFCPCLWSIQPPAGMFTSLGGGAGDPTAAIWEKRTEESLKPRGKAGGWTGTEVRDNSCGDWGTGSLETSIFPLANPRTEKSPSVLCLHSTVLWTQLNFYRISGKDGKNPLCWYLMNTK